MKFAIILMLIGTIGSIFMAIVGQRIRENIEEEKTTYQQLYDTCEDQFYNTRLELDRELALKAGDQMICGYSREKEMIGCTGMNYGMMFEFPITLFDTSFAEYSMRSYDLD
ncbi:hypothetical protein LCGC14_2828850 [marine sediment metagenome]|uniref:Uncharacterized protein n=1 Tax=marine sediment metagenome TaxID=412755 RepID=A0A0F9AN82_9ZZZZ